MRPSTIALPALLLLACQAAVAAAPAAAEGTQAPLAAADCLSPSSVRSWHYVDSRELLVDAGRRKYRITLAESCTDLGSAPSIVFRGDSVSGRVCGHFGERVVTRHGSCRIQRLELMDEASYRQATGTSRGSASAGARQD